MSAPARLLLFGVEQIPLPGFRGRRPALSLVLAAPTGDAEPDPGVVRPQPGQLRLDQAQLLLADAEPEPTQPSLLPEPPFWELAELLSARWADFSTTAVPFSAQLRGMATTRSAAQLRLFA